MDWRVTPIGEERLDALIDLEKQCFAQPWTREQLLYILRGEDRLCLAALTAQGELAGYLGMNYVLDEGYIANVAVAPGYRRQGAAGALIREVSARARTVGLRFLTLEVRESNSAAIALYRKYGFRPVGRRKNYYTAPREDAVLMTKFWEEAKDEDPGV